MKFIKICHENTCYCLEYLYYYELLSLLIPIYLYRVDGFLPKMTPDHCRVFLLRNNIQKFDFVLLDFYRALIAVCVNYIFTYIINDIISHTLFQIF